MARFFTLALALCALACHGEEFEVMYPKPPALGQVCRDEGQRSTYELGPCCEQDAECIAGSYQRHELQCDADCVARCASAQTKEDCRANDCSWLEPNGCFEASDNEWAEPQCVAWIDRTQCPLGADVCPNGMECGTIYVNPCEGRSCSACLATAYLCMLR